MVNYNHISYCSFDVEDTVKPECVKGPLSKRPKVVFQLSLNARQKCCRMLTLEHSAIFLTFIKLPFVIKIFVLSIFEWPIYKGFTVQPLFHLDFHFAYYTRDLSNF